MLQFVETRHPSPLYDFAERLLVDSFPPEERPTLADWRERATASFHRRVILKEKQPVGLLTYWIFPSFTYIEHFAILPSLRNQQLGGEALDQFIRGKECVVLEAELPTDSITTRRINFYQRHGFAIAPYPYLQPAYAEGLPAIPLHILSTKKISAILFEEVKQTLHAEVYGK